MNIILDNSENCYSPKKQLSLDESLLMHCGSLSFRQYIKTKKKRYGLFYEFCSFDEYILNFELYTGKREDEEIGPKTNLLVKRLMAPYLNKGHHLYVDNYYNSVSLTKKLLAQKTHCTGTLCKDRKENPNYVMKRKLKKGEQVWRRNPDGIYESKRKDKRDFYSFGQIKNKPHHIAEYNNYMSGIDPSDQLIRYYCSSKKALRWYKKVLFHFLDMSVWNAFFLKRLRHSKMRLIQICDELVSACWVYH